FNTYSDEEQKLALQSLNDLGQTKLANGQTAAGLKRLVLTDQLAAQGGAGVQSPEDARQEIQLQAQLKQVFDTGIQANQALAGFQKSVFDNFITALRSTQEGFFARLSANLAGEQLVKAQNAIAANRVTR